MKDVDLEAGDNTSEKVGLPGFRRWRSVYTLVAVLLVLYIFFLAAWSRWFA